MRCRRYGFDSWPKLKAQVESMIVPDPIAGYSITASWSRGGIEVIAKKAGQIINTTTYAVSADGRRLTIADGNGESHIVLDRLIQ